jgi:hypothetical protein
MTMNKIAVSILALGAALATPVLANEAVHSGQRVTATSVAPVEAAAPATIAGTLSFASGADRGVAIDPARSAFSGK